MAPKIDATRELVLSDITDRVAAAKSARQLYGPDAMTAVAHCALEAHFAGRRADFHFWVEVFRDLNKAKAH